MTAASTSYRMPTLEVGVLELSKLVNTVQADFLFVSVNLSTIFEKSNTNQSRFMDDALKGLFI